MLRTYFNYGTCQPLIGLTYLCCGENKIYIRFVEFNIKKVQKQKFSQVNEKVKGAILLCNTGNISQRFLVKLLMRFLLPTFITFKLSKLVITKC